MHHKMKNFITSRISHEKLIHEEDDKLKSLQDAEGIEFPGSDVQHENKKEWMKDLDVLSLKVRDVMWPGTHDSATNEIGIAFVTRPFAQCQELSIYEQLCAGIRSFDIRVDEKMHVAHGILESYHVQVVLDDLNKFLSETSSEFIILDIRTEYGKEDPPEFDQFLINNLGDHLITQDPSMFDKKLKDLLPKRVFCVWKPRKSAAPAAGSALFSAAYLKDNWTDTDQPITKFNANLDHLGKQPHNLTRGFFYRVEHTCTPQTSSAVLTVHAVNDRIKDFARLFVSQAFKKNLGDHLQIFSGDFVSNDFVDACIGVNASRVKQISAN